MKFSSNCEEMKGVFGGTYYELKIEVVLTDEEEKLVRQFKAYNYALVGTRHDEGEGALLRHFTTMSPLLKDDAKTSLSIKDLSAGVKLKANNRSELPALLKLEELIKERCKDFKASLEKNQQASDLFGKPGGAKYEEEL